MSVWNDLDALTAFVYRDPDHRVIMRRRREWFEAMEIFMALWCIPAGHVPTLAEGKHALETLAAHNPTPEGFTFLSPVPAPGADAIPRSSTSARSVDHRPGAGATWVGPALAPVPVRSYVDDRLRFRSTALTSSHSGTSPGVSKSAHERRHAPVRDAIAVLVVADR
jgi:Domain of unknown function (DUF3291)